MPDVDALVGILRHHLGEDLDTIVAGASEGTDADAATVSGTETADACLAASREPELAMARQRLRPDRDRPSGANQRPPGPAARRGRIARHVAMLLTVARRLRAAIVRRSARRRLGRGTQSSEGLNELKEAQDERQPG
jgi:hypothetical protein